MSGFALMDIVDPFQSPRRAFICDQLTTAMPNSHTELASNDPATKARFKEWTGVTQEKLEEFWGKENFNKQGNGSWVHDSRFAGNGVFTSCEGLILTLFNKLEQNGFGKRKGGATAFNLAGNKEGREVASPPAGWHWYRDRKPGNTPRAGDFFQTGSPAGPGRWRHAHVGVIIRWEDGPFPKWEVVHAGQGGPVRGYDLMKRTEFKLVNVASKNDPALQIMGWLNIDEHFG